MSTSAHFTKKISIRSEYLTPSKLVSGDGSEKFDRGLSRMMEADFLYCMSAHSLMKYRNVNCNAPQTLYDLATSVMGSIPCTTNLIR